MSTGAKAGIGIGVVALAILVMAALIWFIISRRRIRNLESRLTAVPPEYNYEMAADQRPQAYHQVQSQELDAEVPGTVVHGYGRTDPPKHELAGH